MRRINGSVIGPRMTAIAAVSYSVSFSGSSQYLTLPSDVAFQYGVDNFTTEAWVYRTGVAPSGAGGDQVIFDHRTVSPQVAILLYFNGTSNKISVSVNGADLIVATSLMLTNTWYHVALVRNSSVSTLYINGVNNGSANDSNNYSTTTLVIGGRFAAISTDWRVWQGYISNARIVKGIAVYTGNFSVPTAPLTAIQSAGTNISEIPGAQTSLLTCNATTIVDSSVNQFTITNNGDASVIGAFGIWGLDEAFLNTSTSVFSPLASINSSYLVVAGGGGGGGGGGDANFTYSGGGGGAGGLLQGSITFTKSTTYTITIGAGGAGGVGVNSGPGSNGANSSIIGSGVSIITIGGGAGGGAVVGVSTSGGSGGGAGARNGTSQTGSAGTTGQGNSGGNGGGGTANSGGGGGGGAGGAGTSGNSLYSGNIGSGGAGLSIAITGSSVTYAAGGTPTAATPSYAGSGGGGGGGGYYQTGAPGGTGRDGIVIFAYTTAYGLATATGSYTQTTIGSTDSLGMGAYNYVYTFTGNGTIVFN